jgi:glutamate-1-semialdehyde aminotransferase
MAVAVRLARAATGKDLILCCGYHGWHDWYLAANLSQSTSLNQHLMAGLEPYGVPKALAGSAIPFTYNQPRELRALLQSHRGKVAAIVMEPVRSLMPSPGYLEEVRSLATQNGVALVFDEISSGFRHDVGGYHLKTAVTPDVAVFAKAMSNGYAMAAIIGVSEIMDAASKSFVSSTYWTERIGPAAALANILKIKTEPVVEKLEKLGNEVQKIWQKSAHETGLRIEITGLPAMSYLKFLDGEANVAQSLFTQEMAKLGILASGRYYANFSQTSANLRLFERGTQAAFAKVSAGLRSGNLTSMLSSDPARPGFGRLN